MLYIPTRVLTVFLFQRLSVCFQKYFVYISRLLLSTRIVVYINKMTSDSDKRQTHVDFSRVKRDLLPIPEPRELYTKAQNALQDGPQSPEQLPQGSKRRRTGGAIVKTRARSKEPILPQAADAGVRPHEYMRIKNESP